MKRFTFKTDKPTGRYKSFFPKHHYIKYGGNDVGSIDDEFPFRIRLRVVKKDINEDGNPNCKWRWIVLAKENKSLNDAKTWINEKIEEILTKYTFPTD